MKIETVIKKVGNYHNLVRENISKIRDLLESVEDYELQRATSDWDERFEDFLDSEGSIDELVELLDAIQYLEVDE